MKQELTVNQTLARLHELQGQMSTLQEQIIVRAKLQEISEMDYNELAQMTKELILFLQQCRVGNRIDDEWIAKRDELIQRAQKSIKD